MDDKLMKSKKEYYDFINDFKSYVDYQGFHDMSEDDELDDVINEAKAYLNEFSYLTDNFVDLLIFNCNSQEIKTFEVNFRELSGYISSEVEGPLLKALTRRDYYTQSHRDVFINEKNFRLMIQKKLSQARSKISSSEISESGSYTKRGGNTILEIFSTENDLEISYCFDNDNSNLTQKTITPFIEHRDLLKPYGCLYYCRQYADKNDSFLISNYSPGFKLYNDRLNNGTHEVAYSYYDCSKTSIFKYEYTKSGIFSKPILSLHNIKADYITVIRRTEYGLGLELSIDGTSVGVIKDWNKYIKKL